MAKKKSPNIPDGLRSDLKGFEDIFDEFLDEKSETAVQNKINDTKKVNAYKVYNFLEVERNRTQKLSDMLSKKIPNAGAHNQSQDIIEKFTVYNYNLKEDIIPEIKKFDSIFNKNIREMFNKAFRRKE